VAATGPLLFAVITYGLNLPGMLKLSTRPAPVTPQPVDIYRLD
jgi:hypothetical protein